MNLLINLSVIRFGGGVQVAHSLLQELRNFSQHQYHVVLLSGFKKDLSELHFPDNFCFYVVQYAPSHFYKGYITRKKLMFLERSINPEVVFTLFGPSYWRPKAPHLCGYALPHYVYPESPFFQSISFVENLKLKVRGFLKLRFLKNQSDYFVTETNDVSERLSSLLQVSRDRVFTVSNTCNGVFDQLESWEKTRNIAAEGFTMITVSSFYSHKNLGIITQVIDYLIKVHPGFKFTFVLTIDQGEFNSLNEKQKEHIKFIGKVSIEECPHLYDQADALFLPTLLECFSASYLEAMKMQKPILTSDLSFARDICGDAAIYFNPLSGEDIGESIVKLARDKFLQKTLSENGNNKLKKFGNAKQRTEQYLEILSDIKKG